MAHRKELRIEARARNNVLWHAIYDKWKTARDFCTHHQVSYHLTCRLLGLKESPLNKLGQFRPAAVALAQACGIPPSKLFPLWLYQFERTSMTKEIAFGELAMPDQLRLMLPAPQDPESAFLEKERSLAVQKKLGEMRPRDAIVLKLLFGVGGDEPLNLEEAGNLMGLSTERIRQIKLNGFAELAVRLKELFTKDRVLELIAKETHRSKKQLATRPFTHRVTHTGLKKLPIKLVNLGEDQRGCYAVQGKFRFEPIRYDFQKERRRRGQRFY